MKTRDEVLEWLSKQAKQFRKSEKFCVEDGNEFGRLKFGEDADFYESAMFYVDQDYYYNV